jgi:C4-dicarboxylate transporter DctQ subunit
MKENNSILIDRLIGYFDKILITLVIILGIILIGINAIQIIIRGFFNTSFLWVLEFSEFLGIWIVLLGASVMFLRDTEIKVTVILGYFPEKVRRVIEIMISVLGIVFSIYLIWGNLNYQQYVGIIKPDFLPFSFRVYTYPLYVFGVSVMYNCLNVIFRPDSDSKGRFLE